MKPVPLEASAALPEDLRNFLDTLVPELAGEFIERRSIDTAGKVERTYHSSAGDLISVLRQRSVRDQHTNEYFGVCPRKRRGGTKEDVRRVLCLWADLDSKDFQGGMEEALASLRRFPLKPTAIVNSGHGYHAYWRLKEAEMLGRPEDMIRIERYLKAVAHALGGDPSSAELARILRLPGTMNWKDSSHPVPVTVVELDASREYNLCDFDEWISATGEPSGKHGKTPGWVGEAFRNLHDGNRNETFTSIAGKLNRDHWTPDDILALLEPWAVRTGFAMDELGGLVRGVAERYPSQTQAASPDKHSSVVPREYEAVRLADFLKCGGEKIDWCIDGILPTGGVGIIGGPAGWAKTFMAMDLAIECTRGGKWLGRFATKKMSVLYIDEESPPNLPQIRMRKLLRGKLMDPECADIYVLHQAVIMLTDEDSLAGLQRLIDRLRPGLVIFDSLVRMHGADENSATEMARVGAIVKKLIRDYGCSILFTDHQRKPGNFGGDGPTGDQRLRGSTEKVAFCDSLLSVQSKKLENSREIYTIEHSKSRCAAAVDPFVVCLEDPTKGSTSIYVAGDAEALKQSARLEAAVQFLESNLPQRDWVTRQALVELGRKVGIGRGQIDEVLRSWETDGRVLREDRKQAEGRGGKAAHYRWNPDSVPIPIPTHKGVGTENGNMETREDRANSELFKDLDDVKRVEPLDVARLRSRNGISEVHGESIPSRELESSECLRDGVVPTKLPVSQAITGKRSTPFSVPSPYKKRTENGVMGTPVGVPTESDSDAAWETGTL